MKPSTLARRTGIGKSSAVTRPEPIVWLARALWLVLPAGIGWALAQTLAGRSTPVRLTALAGCWSLWAVGLVALLVPTTVSLTVIRLLAPGAPAVAVATALGGAHAVAGTLAAVSGASAAAAVFSAEVGQRLVQGSAYGDEVRFPLRPPAAYTAGPVPLAWLVLAAGLGSGPMLLAARQWVAGGVLVAIGAALAWPLGRRFHRLSRRWLVVVPAGVVVHDQVALAETVLIVRADVAAVGLAPAATTAADLTAHALGLAVQVDLGAPTAIAVRVGSRAGVATATVTSLLVTPSRPGRVLDECRRRGLPTR